MESSIIYGYSFVSFVHKIHPKQKELDLQRECCQLECENIVHFLIEPENLKEEITEEWMKKYFR